MPDADRDRLLTRSTARVEVVRVKPGLHPNADRLLVAEVWGYTCVINQEDWQGVPRDEEGFLLAAYVPPDMVVDTRRPEFDFLRARPQFDAAGNYLGRQLDDTVATVRTKARKLRGIVSFGFLIPAPAGARVGDDLAGSLGVEHYEPPLEAVKNARNCSTGGETAPAPVLPCPKYDLDAFRRWHEVFVPGEPILASEKLDGANARYVFHDGQMHVGSHREWKRLYPSTEHLTVETLVRRGVPEEKALTIVERVRSKPPQKNLFWHVLDSVPALEAFCRDNPGTVVYGEVFGRQGLLKYTQRPEEVFFAAFDLLREGSWLDPTEGRRLLEASGVPCVPSLNGGTPLLYDFERVCALAEGPSLWPGACCMREGVVISPLVNRWDPKIGRVKLKVVSAAYLEKHR